MKTRIIAMAGKRLTGKTIFANSIKERAEEYGMNIQILPFAFPLKQSFAKYRGVPVEYLSLPGTKEEYREEMMEYSEKCKRNDPYYFTNLLLNQITPTGWYVIDDLRLLDTEAIPLLNRGAAIWRIESDKQVRAKRGWVNNPKVDESIYETDMDLSQETYKCLFNTGVIYNNTHSVGDLAIEADILIRKHFLAFLKEM